MWWFVRRWPSPLACAVALILGMQGAVVRAEDEPVDFVRAVAPVLERHCLRCHSAATRKGGIDLEFPERWAAGPRPLVVPGDRDASLLYQVILGPRPKMPAEGEHLGARDVEAIGRWIDEGAAVPAGTRLHDAHVPDANWWSYQRLTRPAVPVCEGPEKEGLRTPVDAFIVNRLDQEGLQLSPEAEPRQLVRRLYYDLLGLPPLPEEVDAFLGDVHPAAYERLVDRLLASPHYGERWARHWLDVARYADTHGFDKDKVRANAWPYRDYVIRSFNEDKPYREFVLEQIAGDVYRPEDPEATIATGFLVAGPFDWVGQIEVRNGTMEKRRVRYLDRDEMVTAVFNAFLSTTVQCARCHHHKFDPLSQDEYYGLQAVFAGIDRADRLVDVSPSVARRRRELMDEIGRVHEELAEAERRVRERAAARLEPVERRLAEVARGVSPEGKPREFGFHSAISQRQDMEKWVQVDLGRVAEIQAVALFPCHDEYAGIGAGFGFPLRFRVEVATDGSFAGAQVVLDATDMDQPNPGLVPQVVRCPEGTRGRFVRVTATKLAPRSNDFIFALAELAVLGTDGRNLAAGCPVQSGDEVHAPPRWSRRNLTDGRYIGSWSTETLLELASLQAQRREVLSTADPPALRRIEELKQKADRIRDLLGELPAPMAVFAAATDFSPVGNFVPTRGTPRPVWVLNRGDVQQPLRLASPQALRCFPWLGGQIRATDREGERRLALAEWIAHRENPLVWRSIVNRVWHWHFGRGIVVTVDDFGRMGEQPTHPELLDWLATWFRDDARGSIKRLHRLIVTSAVYRQTSFLVSSTAEKGLSVDGENRLLWRMNRRRLEAEVLRDAALRVAGILEYRLYGPPYRNFGFIDDHSPHYLYEKYDPELHEARRRSVYRFVVRSVPDPFMEAFDCPDASGVTGRRNETLTPLQALVGLNDRFVLFAAREWAKRLRREFGDNSEGAVRCAVLEALGRPPAFEEEEVLVELAGEHGLEAVCRALLNLNEFVFVD